MASRAQPAPTRSQFLNDEFQQKLAQWNRRRLTPEFPSSDRQLQIDQDATMLRLEGGFVEELRTAVVREAGSAPTEPDEFVDWFEGLINEGPGQNDELFPWLAHPLRHVSKSAGS